MAAWSLSSALGAPYLVKISLYNHSAITSVFSDLIGNISGHFDINSIATSTIDMPLTEGRCEITSICHLSNTLLIGVGCNGAFLTSSENNNDF